MTVYSAGIRVDPAEAIQKAVEFFGPEGLGMEVIEHSDCCAFFRGAGGHVRVRITNGNGAALEIETREWDYQVKEFMQRIG
jgi:hypothetical protein